MPDHAKSLVPGNATNSTTEKAIFLNTPEPEQEIYSPPPEDPVDRNDFSIGSYCLISSDDDDLPPLRGEDEPAITTSLSLRDSPIAAAEIHAGQGNAMMDTLSHSSSPHVFSTSTAHDAHHLQPEGLTLNAATPSLVAAQSYMLPTLTTTSIIRLDHRVHDLLYAQLAQGQGEPMDAESLEIDAFEVMTIYPSESVSNETSIGESDYAKPASDSAESNAKGDGVVDTVWLMGMAFVLGGLAMACINDLGSIEFAASQGL